jgi:thiol-disulfide isomerase/thioredoxin
VNLLFVFRCLAVIDSKESHIGGGIFARKIVLGRSPFTPKRMLLVSLRVERKFVRRNVDVAVFRCSVSSDSFIHTIRSVLHSLFYDATSSVPDSFEVRYKTVITIGASKVYSVFEYLRRFPFEPITGSGCSTNQICIKRYIYRMSRICCNCVSLHLKPSSCTEEQHQTYVTIRTVSEVCKQQRRGPESFTWNIFFTHYSRRTIRRIKDVAMLFAFLVIVDVLQRTGPTQAYTTPSFYSATSTGTNIRPRTHHTFFAAKAGNAEMEYRQRYEPNNDNNSNNNDDPKLSSNCWREVPGGFLPQLGNNNMAVLNSDQAMKQSTTSSQFSPDDSTPASSSSSSSSSSSTKSPSSSSPMKKNTTPTTMRIRQLSNIKDYKHYVVDDVDPNRVTITVVRFYAPWCRACQAIQQRYYRLAQQYEQRLQSQSEATLSSSLPHSSKSLQSSSSSLPNVVVRFMECPVTKDNAVLHQGLGVPSLPYGHIYHSKAGLVEEMKLNKNVFANFESILASYVNGHCTIRYNDDADNHIPDDTNNDDQSDRFNEPVQTPLTFE